MSDELEIDEGLLNNDEVEDAEEQIDGLVVKLAKEGGWAPKEEWRGKPEQWVRADEYVGRQLKRVASLEDRLKRQDQVNKDTMAQIRQRERQMAEEELRQAVVSGNTEEAIAVARRAAGPEPAVEQFIQKNSSWYNRDFAATQFAIGICNQAASQGLSVQQQMETTQREVEKRFPELFPSYSEPDYDFEEEAPAPRAKPQRQAPAVQPATRSTPLVNTGVKGWKDIPRDDRAGMKEILHSLTANYNLSEEAAKQQMAESYWSERH